ncbi:branched-chain amino acid ABC transporter permease [Undibacterium sp.]|jgi:branched-chain amino acid transport system permease protein|uniref:branched-chain amino acid ABC transporter permease n=1 Tax=Undibacterium sp. TaxID=1914977 RepID=UPI002CA4F3A1|nr:branched-chain amino acid ABC transporter permease [Undibacterium sp.]HTD06021.1 branched-chain amino acid ABC transporter permease [Undibacterium sp.]
MNTLENTATVAIESPAASGKTVRRMEHMFQPKYLLLAAGLILAALVPLFIKDPSHQNLAILILMAAQLGVSWNIIGGYAGQISLGHAAFYGLGAYTSTILLSLGGLNPWLAILAGGILAALISLVIGWSCFRLKGHYFAMATIAVAEIIQIVFTNWEYAGGAVGLTIPMDKQGWSVLIFSDKEPYYYLALGLLLLTLLANFLIERSYLGYYFRAIKDEPDAARSLGISLSKYKQIAFAVSSFFTAIGGSLYAQKELYIDPASVLHTGLSIKMALVSILGGVGTLFGPIVGAGILTLIEEGTRMFFGGSGRGTDLIIYAALIVVIAVYYPSGVLGWFRQLLARRKAKLSQQNKGEQA